MFWLLAGLLGAMQAWTGRDEMNPDGVSYLDIGVAYVRGDWHNAVSVFWSPLYSWLLGATLAVARPSRPWEYPIVHAVNFAIYLAALGSFEFFLRSSSPTRCDTLPADHASDFPEWFRLGFGYTLFLVAALKLVTVELVTPDMLVLASVFLIAGALCRIDAGRGTWGTFLWLGALLGASYLAKAAMFPVALVCGVLAFLAVGEARRAAPRVVLMLAVFALVAGPFVGVVSRAGGRLTFGEVWRLNYVQWVMHANPASLEPPGRRVLEEPAVYEFGTPIAGTFPPSYDPWYWARDVELRFDLGGQAHAVVRNAWAYWNLALRLLPSAMVVLIVLALTDRAGLAVGRHRRGAILGALALAQLVGYALVHVEARYVAGAVVVLILALLDIARPPASGEGRSVLRAIVAALLTLQLLPVALGVAHDTAYAAAGTIRGAASARGHAAVADALRESGVGPGDSVAVTGSGFLSAAWARLAGVKIVATVPDPDGLECWTVDDTRRARLLAALASTGAKALVVARPRARVAAAPGWTRLGASDYYAYLLR